MTCLFKSERKDACPDTSGCWSWGFGVSYLRGAEPPEQAQARRCRAVAVSGRPALGRPPHRPLLDPYSQW